MRSAGLACLFLVASCRCDKPDLTLVPDAPYAIEAGADAAADASDAAAGTRATALILGDTRSCALLSDGRLRCWGSGKSEAKDVKQASAGKGATCIVTLDGAVSCEGKAVSGLTAAMQVSAGEGHACALKEDGSGACWGKNDKGQLGDGTKDAREAPVAVAGLPGPIQHLAAGRERTCAVVSDGTVWCWGGKPAKVAKLKDALQVALGGDLACAVLVDATVHCWKAQAEPEKRVDIGAVKEIAMGPGRVCALMLDATVQCWDPEKKDPPATVATLMGVHHVAVGDGHACALKADGSIWCWGKNDDGQVGDGTKDVRAVPTLAKLAW